MKAKQITWRLASVTLAICSAASSRGQERYTNTKENDVTMSLIRAEASDAIKLKALIAAHADINAKNANGATVLIVAAQRGTQIVSRPLSPPTRM